MSDGFSTKQKEELRAIVDDVVYLRHKPVHAELKRFNQKESEDTDALAETVVKHDRKLIRHDRAIKIIQAQVIQA